jgi:hypothetical protein
MYIYIIQKVPKVGQNHIITPNMTHNRMFDEIPAKKFVYTPYVYGSGQP